MQQKIAFSIDDTFGTSLDDPDLTENISWREQTKMLSHYAK